MKARLRALLLAIPLLVGMEATANTGSEDDFIAVCQAAKDNNVSQLRKNVKRTGMKLRKLYPVLECNELPLVAFAMQYGSEDAASYVVKRTKSKDLREPVAGLNLREWFLAQGFDSSPVYSQIIEKI